MTRAARIRDHLRKTLALGLPLVGSQIAQMAINMTDTVMLGWYDVEALAALVLASSFYIVLFLFGSGFAFALVPLVAAAGEADDHTRVRRVTRMALWISLGFGALVMPSLFFAAPVLRLFGQEPQLAEMAQTYLRIMGWGMLPGLGIMVLKSYLSGLERTRVQLWVTVGAAVANVGLNWVLIFGNLGAPELGIRGAAIASLTVTTLSVVALALYATRSFPSHHLFQRIWRPDWDAARELFAMGWHIGVTTVAEVGFFVASSFIMGVFGIVPLAAHGIALQITSFTFMVPLGLSSAATVRAGRAQKRGDAQGLREGAQAVFLMGLGWAVLAMVIFFAFGPQLAGLYVDPSDPLAPEIVAQGVVLLRMAAAFQFFDVTQVLAMALLRGLHDTRVPMWIATASYWVVGMPISLALGVWAGFGGIGVWTGLLAGLGVAAVLLVTRFWRKLPGAIAA